MTAGDAIKPKDHFFGLIMDPVLFLSHGEFPPLAPAARRAFGFFGLNYLKIFDDHT